MRIIKTPWVNTIIRRIPIAITRKLTPRSKCPVLCRRWFVTINSCSSTIPKHTIGSSPTRSLTVLTPIAKPKCIAVYIDNIKQYTRCPTINGSTKIIRKYGTALYKCIGSCWAITGCKIMVAIACMTALK